MIEILNVRVIKGGYLVNGYIPTYPTEALYSQVETWKTDGKEVMPEFTESELLQQKEDAKPKIITPLQARLALSQLGIRQQVENSMLTATQDVKDFYEFALEWKRDNTQLITMATSLGMDSIAIDNFFLLASTL
jgi:hypothetical protein